MAKRAVFLDRDGVLNRAFVRDGIPHPPEAVAEFEILPGVPEACQRLKAAGYFLIVATNQPDVGRGTQDRATVEEMHRLLLASAPIDAVEVCWHSGRGEPCACRKPLPGMLLAAAARHDLDLRLSWMIGDRWRDIDCGAAAGCRTIFIEGGHSEPLRVSPDFTARSLAEAADIVLQR